MSGPTTTFVYPGSITVLLAEAAIEAVRATREAALEAERIGERFATRADAMQAQQEAALREGAEVIQSAVEAAQARFAALLDLARQLGIAEQVEALRPAAVPAGAGAENAAQTAAYVQQLLALSDKVGAVLNAEAQRQKEQQGELPTDLTLPAARQTLAQRQLARIAHLGTVPAQVEKLAQELQAAPPGERAELLANELRHSVQTLLEAEQRAKIQKATAVVMAQTLKDLGYQVEEIPQTLFVEGGVVHLRRAGWGDYMVRMRADAKASTLNFNVIRAVEAGANERSAMDHIAEDRWCSEFPALLKALEARGIGMEITRRLGAGELPVQLVDRARLPTFAEEEQAMPRAQPKARELK